MMKEIIVGNFFAWTEISTLVSIYGHFFFVLFCFAFTNLPFLIINFVSLQALLHKNWSFPLRIFSVDVTKSTASGSEGFILNDYIHSSDATVQWELVQSKILCQQLFMLLIKLGLKILKLTNVLVLRKFNLHVAILD